jgi:hypothetical protein
MDAPFTDLRMASRDVALSGILDRDIYRDAGGCSLKLRADHLRHIFPLLFFP